MESFDLIIIGAGASGLFLADRLISDPYFKDHRILLIEKGDKKKNDRTWCFWEKGAGPLDSIVHKQWEQLRFAAAGMEAVSEIEPYRYKMIRGIDFYDHYLPKVRAASNFKYLQTDVKTLEETDTNVCVQTGAGSFVAKQVFNSIYDPKKPYQQEKFPVLQQHFLGWRVRTEGNFFDPETATFMDFSVPQNGNTRFMYILPFSSDEALLEYTLFSGEFLPKKEYEEAIRDYLENLGVRSYEILETEQGSIPMTCYPFPGSEGGRIHGIGMAGGWAKPSTGYTFYNAWKKSAAVVSALKKGKAGQYTLPSGRFWWYDLWMLDFLYQHNERGHELFTSLFKKRDARLILKFLDEETNFFEELKIISACPKRSLGKIALQRLFRWNGPSRPPRTA